MKLDTEIAAKSSVSAPLIILYYSSNANSAVPDQPFTSPRSIAKSSQPTIEIGVEVPILQALPANGRGRGLIWRTRGVRGRASTKNSGKTFYK